MQWSHQILLKIVIVLRQNAARKRLRYYKWKKICSCWQNHEFTMECLLEKFYINKIQLKNSILKLNYSSIFTLHVITSVPKVYFLQEIFKCQLLKLSRYIFKKFLNSYKSTRNRIKDDNTPMFSAFHNCKVVFDFWSILASQ